MKTTHSPAPWNVNPDYGKENVYRLWDKDSNYHADTSPEAMDANASLISAAPELLEALLNIHKLYLCPAPKTMKDWSARVDVMANFAREAIAKAEGR